MANRLPNSHWASVSLAQLRGYCLSTTHPEGKHQARVFAAALGVTAADAVWLQEQLLRAAQEGDAVEKKADEYGTRYQIDWPMRDVMVRTSWLVPSAGDCPRLITCYVLA